MFQSWPSHSLRTRHNVGAKCWLWGWPSCRSDAGSVLASLFSEVPVSLVTSYLQQRELLAAVAFVLFISHSFPYGSLDCWAALPMPALSLAYACAFLLFPEEGKIQASSLGEMYFICTHCFVFWRLQIPCNLRFPDKTLLCVIAPWVKICWWTAAGAKQFVFHNFAIWPGM